MMIPDTESELLYYRWYELNLLYYDAVRRDVVESEILATKVMADIAWDAYIETISDLNGPRKE